MNMIKNFTSDWHGCYKALFTGLKNRLSFIDCIKLLVINCAVEPLLTDTSPRRTPLVSGHFVMFSAKYKHYIFNLL